MPNRSRDWCVECESRQWGGSVDHPEHLPPEGGSPFKGVTEQAPRRHRAGGRVIGGPKADPTIGIGQVKQTMAWYLWESASRFAEEHPGSSLDEITGGMDLTDFWAWVKAGNQSGLLPITPEQIYQDIILNPREYNHVLAMVQGHAQDNNTRVIDDSYLAALPGTRGALPSGGVEHRISEKDRASRRRRLVRRLYPSLRGGSTAGPDSPHKDTTFGF